MRRAGRMSGPPAVLVSGLSGAGKSTVLRALEDLGFDAVDNPPLALVEELLRRAAAEAQGEAGRRVAIGVDARTRGFDAEAVLATLARLRQDPGPRLELVFVWAEAAVLQRRFTETRRRHPLATGGQVRDGIVAEQALTAPLRDAADLVIDTSDMTVAELRRQVEQRFGTGADTQAGLAVTLVSFAFPAGLPREADMVLDVRFLSNPHYVSDLKPKTGLDAAVARFVQCDPDYDRFMTLTTELLDLLLPRFVREGKKYATVAVGCTGGRHRSVHIIERLALHLVGTGWRTTVSHRELAREGLPSRAAAASRSVVVPGQAQEA